MAMQPIVDLTSGRPTVFEALARLRRADGVLVAAADFVPALDSHDVDVLFAIALDLSLGHLAAWNLAGIEVDVSVNLDPSTLANARCAGWVANALGQHGIDPARLILELLETGPIGSPTQDASIDALGRLGVRIAIDDLGSGHSTLDRLRHVDFDLIKIDSGTHSGFDLAPVETLHALSALIDAAAAQGRPSVVEGLESLDMLGVAAALGADLGQGYVIARPMPAAEVPAWTARSGPLLDSVNLATFPAALAYHWRYSRSGRHPGTTADCPITRLLAGERDLRGLRLLHAAQHAAARSADSAQSMTRWFVDRMALAG
jgi:EAL domain-containing protein (putative c-di-GMP-specific phosphodiesterase class I)